VSWWRAARARGGRAALRRLCRRRRGPASPGLNERSGFCPCPKTDHCRRDGGVAAGGILLTETVRTWRYPVGVASLLRHGGDADRDRDLSTLVVPAVGAVVMRDDPWEPVRLIDGGGERVARVTAFLKKLLAFGSLGCDVAVVCDGPAALVPVRVAIG